MTLRRDVLWIVTICLAILVLPSFLPGTQGGCLLAQDNPCAELQQQIDDYRQGIVEFRVGSGDLFLFFRNTIAAPPNPEELLSRHQVVFDFDGFRNTSGEVLREYDILAVGDALTEGIEVARPWPDLLGDNMARDVRNMGVGGAGLLEQFTLMDYFTSRLGPEIIIQAVYGGKDLLNGITESSRPYVVRNLPINLFDTSNQPYQPTEPGPYRFPVTVEANGVRTDFAFHEDHIMWLNSQTDQLSESANIAAIRNAWFLITEIPNVLADRTCVMIAYLPSKAEVYAPFVVPEDRGDFIGENPYSYVLTNGKGSLFERQYAPVTWDEMMETRLNVHDLFIQEATWRGFEVVDLSIPLSEAASRGEVVFYPYDTHLNERGHEIVANAIADFILNQGACRDYLD